MNSYEDLLRDAFPQRGTRVGPEDAECLKYVDWLRKQSRAGWLRAVWFHVPNEGKRSWRMGALQRAKGLMAGTPDYVLLYDTGAVCIEFKSKIGRQSKTQREFEKWCRHEGIPYKLVRSAAEAIEYTLGMSVLWGRDDP